MGCSLKLQVGICPQHDTLWPTMTAREHLLLYGRIKGLLGRRTSGCCLQNSGLQASALHMNGDEDLSSALDIDTMVSESLEAVGLMGVADRACSTYRYGCALDVIRSKT